MGAKTRILRGFLDEVLDDEVPRGGTVLDLFSGTGVVSAFCAQRFRTIANDVQLYARILAQSLIEHDPATRDAFVASLSFERDLSAGFEENRAALSALYRQPLELERELLAAFAERPRARSALDAYRDFLELPGALYGDGGAAGVYSRVRSLLSEASLAAFRADPTHRPFCLLTAYYANVYFGLRQAIELDSLRAAIDGMAARGPFAQRKRVHYLAALLLTASVSTSGTSHFAQPRHLRKDSEVDAMARRRRIDVVETFRSFCAELRDFVAATSYVAGNRALVGDYRALLEPVDGGGSTALRFRPEAASDLVYMDPPYTADHYSRFYHVLEVLAAYDYPPLARGADGRVVRGRYPVIERRFQSPFCVRRSVEAEFDRVIRGAAATGAKLVISYGYPSGLLFKVYAGQRPRRDPIARLEALCLASYAAVKTLRRPFLHSGQGDKNLSVEELLVVCSRPRGGSAARVASSTGMATRA